MDHTVPQRTAISRIERLDDTTPTKQATFQIAAPESPGHPRSRLNVSNEREANAMLTIIITGHRASQDPNEPRAASSTLSRNSSSTLTACSGTEECQSASRVRVSTETLSTHEANPLGPGQPGASLLHVLSSWRWELFTWLLGTFGFVLIQILILVCSGMFQKDWHSHVQLTTFVAALAQISQSALLVPTAASIAQLKWQRFHSVDRPAADLDRFDAASRGPDGSIRLLGYLGWRP